MLPKNIVIYFRSAAFTAVLSIGLLAGCSPGGKIDPEVYNAFEAVGLIQDTHYKLAAKPLVDLPMQEPAEISVLEFFWYGCSHCFLLEEPINLWSANLPASVHFQKIPAAWSDAMELHARAFFLADELGLTAAKSQLFPLILSFREIKDDLTEQKSRLKSFFTEFYMQPDEFETRWNSEQMDRKLEQAAAWQKQSGLRGTPSIVVDGKYLLNNQELSKPEQLLDATNKMLNALTMLQQTAR